MTVAPRSTVSAIGPETPKIRSFNGATPLWLRLLTRLQHRSSVITFLLVAATLWVYGATVYSQQVWSKEYYKLQTLQRQERQLTAEGEVLKNQLAEQAETQDTGLIPPTPANNVFLEAAPERSTKSENVAPKTAPNPKLSPTPLGY